MDKWLQIHEMVARKDNYNSRNQTKRLSRQTPLSILHICLYHAGSKQHIIQLWGDDSLVLASVNMIMDLISG